MPKPLAQHDDARRKAARNLIIAALLALLGGAWWLGENRAAVQTFGERAIAGLQANDPVTFARRYIEAARICWRRWECAPAAEAGTPRSMLYPTTTDVLAGATRPGAFYSVAYSAWMALRHAAATPAQGWAGRVQSLIVLFLTFAITFYVGRRWLADEWLLWIAVFVAVAPFVAGVFAWLLTLPLLLLLRTFNGGVAALGWAAVNLAGVKVGITLLGNGILLGSDLRTAFAPAAAMGATEADRPIPGQQATGTAATEAGDAASTRPDVDPSSTGPAQPPA
jgi:hypothetical protein